MGSRAQRSLFGGALVSAGLVATQVAAQSFNISRATGGGYVIEYASGTFDFDNSFAYGPFAVQSNVNSDGISVGAYASASSTTIRASAFINDQTGFGGRAFGASSYTYFTVSHDVTAVARWDWTQGGSYGSAYVTDLTAGQLLLDTSGLTSGSQLISLVSGHEYVVFCGAAVLGGTQQSFCEVSVPGCYADFTGDEVLDLFDFLGYVNAFNAGDGAADCDGDEVLDLFDFLCFVNAFNAGC
jgi:hypothetical protein